MIPESLQISAFVAVVLAVVSFIIIPAIALNDRMELQEPSAAMLKAPDGTSCALPPALDIEESGTDLPAGPLSIDDNKGRALKTATFALG